MVLELSVLICFLAVLATALAFKVKLVFALLAGLALFAGYALVRGHGLRQVLSMCGRGIFTTRKILTLFLLLGLLTALWRAGGVIPLVVCHGVNVIHGSFFLLAVFLLNAAMSLLTGTALGTAATVGVICATMGHALGVSSCWVGGAILAGVYFGNRLSPISSMALLTATITGTDIYGNVRRMLKTTWLPLLLSCGIYLGVGLAAGSGSMGAASPDGAPLSAVLVRALFATEFTLSPWGALPVLLMVLLSVFRVRSTRVLLLSALAALPLAFAVEGHGLSEIVEMLFFGYRSPAPPLAKMINGGGLLSMLNVFLIVVIAGCYGGIFKETGLLSPLKGAIERLAAMTNPFVAKLATASLVACAVCNQTLTILLTHQLTEKLGTGFAEKCSMDFAKDRSDITDNSHKNAHALDLYDTAVTVIALVPWSVATAMVLATANAPATSVLCACFLYLLPLCRAFFPKGRP